MNVLASVSSTDVEGNQNSGLDMSLSTATMSSDGRYVAFASTATNLVPAASSGYGQIYVRDLVAGTTRLASVSSTGQVGNGASSRPSISTDGRYVAFDSCYVTNLVRAHVDGCDVYVHDLRTGRTVLGDQSGDGAPGNNVSGWNVLSASGRYLAFYSFATNLVHGATAGTQQVFLRDLVTGTTQLVSRSVSGAESNDSSGAPGAVSADGRYVTYQSAASNLVPGDTNGQDDVFRRDMLTGRNARVSVTSSGAQGDNGGWLPSATPDGQEVAFLSASTDLVPGDTNGAVDVFVHNMRTGVTTRVDVTSSGAQTTGLMTVTVPTLSADGRYVCFGSDATNVVAHDTNNALDAFIHDTVNGTTWRVDWTAAGQQTDQATFAEGISGDGRQVEFATNSTGMRTVPGNGFVQVYVRTIR